MRRYQSGITFIGGLVLLVVVGGWVYIGIRLVPVYLNYMKIAGTLDKVKDEFGANPTNSDFAIRKAIERHFDIESVDNIGPGDIVIKREGELKSGGYRRKSILADALEPVVGAIYLDGGMDPARAVVERLLRSRLDSLPPAAQLKDAKTRLQETLQGSGRELPVYTVLAVSGPPHQQTFRVRCELPDADVSAEAEGSSRRRAEQEAARLVHERLAGREPAP